MRDIVHVLVPEQRLERTKPEQFVLDFLDQPGAVNFGKQAPFFVEDLGDRLRHLGRSHTGLETLQARHVEGLEQPVMHCELELLEAVGQHVALARFGRVRSHQRIGARCVLGRSGLLGRDSFNEFHALYL